MTGDGSRCNRLLRRLHGTLLRCMPRGFRERHRGEIERTLADGENGAHGVHYGVGAVVDLAFGLAAEWGRVLRRTMVADPGRDARVALRGLGRSPGFTVLSTLALALGMGANATVLSVVNEIVLRPLPVGEPDRLVNVYVDQPGTNSFTGFSWPEFHDYRAARTALQDIAAISATGLRYGDAGNEVRVAATLASANYFDVLEVTPARGRWFSFAEADSGAPVAVISHGFWQRRAGGRTDIVGSTVRLNDSVFTVVGVAPAGFTGTFIGFPTELWLPLNLMPRVRPGLLLESRAEQPLELFGRLAADATPAAAEASLDAVAAELEADYPELYRNRRVKVFALSGIDRSMHDGVMGFVGLLLVLAGLVLMTACLNVGGMLLARGSYRAGELAVRAALGASRGALARQALVETGVLFALGTAAALVVARQLNTLLRRFIEALPVPLGFELRIDGRVLALLLAVGLATALATALGPAMRMSSWRESSTLLAGRRHGAASQRVRSGFLIGQVALSLVLLVCAGLFVRAAQRGGRIETGFDVAELASATIGLPAERYTEAQAVRAFELLTARVEASPLVEGAAFAALPPIDVARNSMSLRVPGMVDRDGDDRHVVDVNTVGGDYFSVTGLPLLAGRVFRKADHAAARHTAVINRTAATTFWPAGGAVGRELQLDGTALTVIGVVDDSRSVLQDAEPSPLVYLPAGQHPARRMAIILRSRADNGSLAQLVREELAAFDGDLSPPQIAPLSQLIEVSLLPQRLAGRFAAGLGVLALALAVCGVYGIVAYAVGCRRRELGIRVALGGAPGGLVRWVMRKGLALVVVGMVLGVLGLAALEPLLGRFLLDVSPFDPLALAGAVLALLAASVPACWLPARHAARVDPVIALRAD